MTKWLSDDEIDDILWAENIADRLLAQAKEANRLRARLEDLKQTLRDTGDKWLAHASRIEHESRSDYADGREDATYECGSLIHELLEGGE